MLLIDTCLSINMLVKVSHVFILSNVETNQGNSADYYTDKSYQQYLLHNEQCTVKHMHMYMYIYIYTYVHTYIHIMIIHIALSATSNKGLKASITKGT